MNRLKSPQFLLALIMITLACLSAWAQETPRQRPTHGVEESDGTGSVTSRPLLFLGNRTLPPMIYMQDGKRVGIVVDLAEAIRRHMNRPVSLKYMDWSRAQQLVLEGKADALLQMNPSERREELFDFSAALLESEFSIFIHYAREGVYDTSSLRGLQVGAEEKGLPLDLLKRDPSISIVVLPDIVSGFHSLYEGTLDAVVVDRWVGSLILAENNIRGIRIAGDAIDKSSSAIAVRKGNTELLVEINRALAEIKKDGTYTEIIAKWHPKEVVFQTKAQALRQKRILAAICAVAGVASVIILLFVFWNRSLKRKVDGRTAEVVEREERFRSLVEQSPLAVEVLSPEGQILHVNAAWRRLWDFNEEETAQVLAEYNMLTDKQAVDLGVGPLIRKAFAGEPVVLPPVEYVINRTMEDIGLKGIKGRSPWIQCHLHPVNGANGEIAYVVNTYMEITERKQAEEAIQDYQKRLRALAYQLAIAEERERRRIAVDLHDLVGQSLAVARMQIDVAIKSASDAGLAAKLNDVSETLRETVQNARHLMFDLSPPSMHEIGLGAAISEWLEEQIGKRYGIKGEFFNNIEKSSKITLNENTRAILFRNVRELLNNVIKHAGANRVSVSMEHVDAFLKIIVQDDGAGFNARKTNQTSRIKSGFGLFSIEERMINLGGSLELKTEPGKGCTACLTIPLDKGME